MKVQEHAFHSWNIIILRKALKNILQILLLISKTIYELAKHVALPDVVKTCFLLTVANMREKNQKLVEQLDMC